MDVVAYASRHPNIGETIHGDSFATALGGKGFNQAFAVRRAGADVVMLGNIGNDNFANEFVTAFKDTGIDGTHVGKSENLGTGIAHILVDSGAKSNSIVIIPQASGLTDEKYIENNKSIFNGANVLMIQNEIPMNGTVAAAKAAKAAGVKVIFTPAPVGDFAALKGLCDLMVPNEIEAQELTGISKDDPAAQAKALHEKFDCKNIVITLGDKGALVSDGNKVEIIAAPKVVAVDTVAAGDTFCANLAANWSNDLFAAAKIGVYAASLKVTRRGSGSATPTMDEVKEFMKGAN
jgi:ribokinase